MRAAEITAILGPVDEDLIAEINRIGATPEELAEAWTWANAGEAMINEGRAMASGRVLELIALFESVEEDAA